ncbi:19287_t:CDS:1, partial [Funneliformis geosporum]
NYHCIGENEETLFRLFEIPKDKKDLIINADSAIQTYWTHIHNDPSYASLKFKEFNYLSSGIL